MALHLVLGIAHLATMLALAGLIVVHILFIRLK